jgi:LPXTG-motif cell wall-anchored protein
VHTYATAADYTVSVTASDDDGGSTQATASATIAAVPPPPPPPPPSPPVDLRLTVAGGEGTTGPGERFTYRTTLTNASPDVDAEGVVVTIGLDPNLDVATPSPLTAGVLTQQLTAPWTCTGTATITCVLAGPLTGGSNVALDVPVVVDPAATGQLTTTFSVSADTDLVSPVVVERISTIAVVVDDPAPGPGAPTPVVPTPVVPVTPDPIPFVPVTPASPAPATPGPTIPTTPIDTVLPETGSDTGSWLAAALGLIVLGCLGVRLAHRPRRPT